MEDSVKKIIGKYFLYLLLTLALLTVGASGYHYYKTLTDSKNDYMFEVGEAIIEIAEREKHEMLISMGEDGLDWIGPDDFVYTSDEAESIEIGLYSISDADTDSEEYYSSFLQKVRKKIDQIMLKNGFVKNELNTGVPAQCLSEGLSGYERGDIKCTLTDIDALSKEYKFSCSSMSLDSDEYSLQKEILRDLDKFDEVIESFSVDQSSVSFSLSTRGSCGGYIVFAQEIDDEWVSVSEGQDLTACSVLEEYNFSTTLAKACYDEDFNVVER